MYPLFLLCPNGLKPLYNKHKGHPITQLALCFQESLDAAVSLIWVLFDMVILIVLIYAFRYWGYKPEMECLMPLTLTEHRAEWTDQTSVAVDERK